MGSLNRLRVLSRTLTSSEITVQGPDENRDSHDSTQENSDFSENAYHILLNYSLGTFLTKEVIQLST